jgi:predicted amidophosphoribosyltransferase
VLNGPLIDLLFPSRCAVCDCSGKNLCESCRDLILIEPKEFSVAGLRVFTVTKYTNETSKLLVALKEKGQSALVTELAQMLRPAIDAISLIESPIYLVPAPSRPENFSKRGFHPTLLIAKAIANQSPGLSVLNCLKFSRPVLDQVGLSEGERLANLSSSMRLNQPIRGRVCYLLDDVVTTGATASESKRVLSLGGATVAGVLALSYSKG